MTQRHAWGVVSALVGASLWGFSGTLIEFMLANYAVSSLFITFVRAAGASVLFLGVIFVRNRQALREIMGDARALGRLVAFGACGVFCSQIAYLITIGFTNAGTATVLQSISIVMIMLATCIVAKRLPHAAEMLGLLLALVATVLIATQGDLGTLHLPAAGLFWGLLSACAATCYAMIAQPLYPRWGSFTVVGLGMVVSGVFSGALWGLAFAFPEIDAAVSAGRFAIVALEGAGL